MLRAMIDLDHLPYLALFLGGIVVALAIGAFLSSRNRSKSPVERLALLICPPVVVITLALAAMRIIQTPDNDWNAARLAPAVALLSGAKLYVGPGDLGAVMNTVDPPLAYLVYLPAGIFSRATSAILAGSSLSFSLYLAPAFVLCFWGRNRPWLMGVACMMVFAQATLTSKSLGLAAFFIHADAPMLAFTGLAGLALYLGDRSAKLSTWTCLISTSCASMAVWSELSAAPAIAALPLWVLATRGLRESVRYTLWLVATLTLLAILFVGLFGFGSLKFNIIGLPRRTAWIFSGPALTDGLILISTEFFCGMIASVAALALAVFARWSFASSDSETAGNGLRRRLVDNPWLLFVLIAIASIPASFATRNKVGGYLNDEAPAPYFLGMALIAVLLEWYARNRERGLESFNALLRLSLLLLVVAPLTWTEDNFQALGIVHRPNKNPQEVAYRYSKRHPGTVFFPWNPLSTVLGERHLYHFEYGLVEREAAGEPVTEAHFRQALPEKLRYVCFPPHYAGLREQFEKTMKYLPEFTRRVEIEELPGWTCYERTLISDNH